MSRIAPQTHEPVELDPRRAFTPKQRLQVLLASDGKCARCGDKLGKTWECDHVLPWSQGGRTEVGNAESLCGPCHAPKTGRDTTATAKCKRLSGEAGGGAKREIRSRGFDQSLSKGMDGKVRPRKSRVGSV